MAGGFALRTLQNGTVVMRNPFTVHLIPMLDGVLALARSVILKLKLRQYPAIMFVLEICL